MANKTHDLVRKLIDRTNLGKLSWETTAEHGTYQASFPNHAVRLFTRRTLDGADVDYVLTLHGEDGEMVDEITDIDLRDSGFENAYKQMGHLYNEARRKAMGVDNIIDGLLSELQD